MKKYLKSFLAAFVSPEYLFFMFIGTLLVMIGVISGKGTARLGLSLICFGSVMNLAFFLLNYKQYLHASELSETDQLIEKIRKETREHPASQIESFVVLRAVYENFKLLENELAKNKTNHYLVKSIEDSFQSVFNIYRDCSSVYDGDMEIRKKVRELEKSIINSIEYLKSRKSTVLIEAIDDIKGNLDSKLRSLIKLEDEISNDNELESKFYPEKTEK